MNSSMGVPMTRMIVLVRRSMAGSGDSSRRPVGSSADSKASAPVSLKGTRPALTWSIFAWSMSLMPTR